MKINNAHYAHMKTAIGQFSATRVEEHRAAVIRQGKAKDIEKRVRWDLCYGAGLSQWLCDNVYKYADDSHIDTALRQIMRELYGVSLAA